MPANEYHVTTPIPGLGISHDSGLDVVMPRRVSPVPNTDGMFYQESARMRIFQARLDQVVARLRLAGVIELMNDQLDELLKFESRVMGEMQKNPDSPYRLSILERRLDRFERLTDHVIATEAARDR